MIIGYFSADQFKERVFILQPNEITGVAARSFAVWTLLTCSCCIFAAFNLNNRPIYLLTLWSFIVALLYFILEFYLYKTVNFQGALSPFLIASFSIYFMLNNGIPSSIANKLKK